MGHPGASTIAGMMMEDGKLGKVIPGTLELGKMDHIVHCLLRCIPGWRLLGGRDS
jgi:hypothetical protein